MKAWAESGPDGWTLVLERDLRHPPTAVWAALTEPAQLDAWAPFTAGRDLAATGPAVLTMVDGEQRVDLPATVTRAEPPRLLEYSWGDDLLRWDLVATPDGTRLTLRHRVADPDDLSRAAAGWHLCLDVADRLLAGEPARPVRGREALEHGWTDLEREYAAQLR